LKLDSPFLIKLQAVVFTAGMWLLFRTLRIEVRESVPGTNPYSSETKDSFFYSVWHDSMLIPTFGGKHRRSAALTSRHTDGSMVAHVLRLVGMSTIRGSTNRISPGAIRELIKTAEDKHVVITPDGPRGPRREMSVGITYLASRTGRAIIPTAFSCTRCWKIKGSWTDLVIPKPFAKIYLLMAAPCNVPAELDTDSLEEYKNGVQKEMDIINEVADKLVIK